MVTVRSEDGGEFEAYLATPLAGKGPGVVIMQEIFGINRVMRDVADWYASKGFTAIVPDLFWRLEPGLDLDDRNEADRQRAFALYEKVDETKAVEDSAAAMNFLCKHESCTGRVGGVGFCLGGKLAYLLAARHEPDCAVGYYGVGIEKALDEAKNISNPLMLHVAGKDQFCDAAARAALHGQFDGQAVIQLHDYPDMDHAFARKGGEHFDPVMGELADLRTLEFLRANLGMGTSAPQPDWAALWEEHIKYEFETRDYKDTLETMVDDAYVNHIPTLTGGVGMEQLAEFYSKRFIPQMPPDTEMIPVSRTVGSDRLVDEMIFKFTHTIEMDWMLPGIAPTGKCVEVPLVAIVHFRHGKLAHEHIYWDQASVLVQLGLIDPTDLPVMGKETAMKVLDTSYPSNALIVRADQRKK